MTQIQSEDFHTVDPGARRQEAHRLKRALCGRRWIYRRVGYDERPMTFGSSGILTEGSAGCEQHWQVDVDEEGPWLSLFDGSGRRTCLLYPDGEGRWSGGWIVHERMPVELLAEDRLVEAERESQHLPDAGSGSDAVIDTDGESLEVFFPYWEKKPPADGYGGAAIEMLRHQGHGGLRLGETHTGQRAALIFRDPTSLERYVKDYGTQQKRILYTMYESSDWLPEWISSFNRLADLVLVPCEWNRRCLLDQGVRVPVEVVPLGAETDIFTFKDRTAEVGSDRGRKFRFVTYNAGDVRKGFPVYLDAFLEEFAPEEPVELVLKTLNNGERLKPYLRHRNVRLAWGAWSKHRLRDLLHDCDCFVFPSRAEGFGLPPLEAMATGMPAIVTRAHAHLNFCDPSRCYGIETRLAPADFGGLLPRRSTGQWFEPDKADLRRVMRHVYQNQGEAMRIGAKGAKWVSQHLSYPTVMRRLAEVIRRHL